MQIKPKIPLVLLLLLTAFSVGLMGYTLYEILMIRLATKSVQISVHDLTVDFNNNQPRVIFKIVFKNIVNTYLGIFYIRIDVYLNNTKVTYKPVELGYANPVSLPLNVDKELKFSANVTTPSNSSPKENWAFKVYVIFSTSLIQHSGVERWVTYDE